MAYPALLTAPFQINVNFHAAQTAHHKYSRTVRFMAASLAAGETIAAVFESAQTGTMTSVNQGIGAHLASGAPYPTGSRVTVTALCEDSDQGLYRVSARNWNTTAPVNTADFANLLLGTVSSETTPLVTALLAPPQSPITGLPLTVANVAAVTKRF